jgi:hypothetical protein
MQATNLYDQKRITKSLAKLDTQLQKIFSASRGLCDFSSPCFEANDAVRQAREHLDKAILKIHSSRRSLES